MKKIFTITAFIICCLMNTYAQQQQQYTQFMFNKLAINPGYAGSNDAACFTGIYRHQWTGVAGAPMTQVLSFNTPLFNNRVGAGGNIIRNTIGITTSLTVDGDYAYRLPLGRGTLGMGVNASVQYLSKNFSDPRLIATQGINNDQAIEGGKQYKYLPNFGLGLYYNTKNYYVGVSVPRLLNNNIDFSNLSSVISREVTHAYLMTGVLFKIANNIEMQPQVLLKYAAHSPLDADANVTFVFSKNYAFGMTYRLGGSSQVGFGESMDIMFSAQINDHLLFGLSYDVTLSEIKKYDNGSIEAVVRYCLGRANSDAEFDNPRFF